MDVTKTNNRLLRVSKVSNKNLFVIKVFKVCDLKAQQRFFLDEEISITKKELAATPNRLRHFLKQYNHARKATLYPLPKLLQEIGFTLWMDELFSHYYLDVKEHNDRHLRLSFRFEKDKNCCFSLKKISIWGKSVCIVRNCQPQSQRTVRTV